MKRLIIFFTILITFSANAVPLGDDGLHKPMWLRLTFKDMKEDLEEANIENKRLLII